jgi:hypothetical protein
MTETESVKLQCLEWATRLAPLPGGPQNDADVLRAAQAYYAWVSGGNTDGMRKAQEAMKMALEVSGRGVAA